MTTNETSGFGFWRQVSASVVALASGAVLAGALAAYGFALDACHPTPAQQQLIDEAAVKFQEVERVVVADLVAGKTDTAIVNDVALVLGGELAVQAAEITEQVVSILLAEGVITKPSWMKGVLAGQDAGGGAGPAITPAELYARATSLRDRLRARHVDAGADAGR